MGKIRITVWLFASIVAGAHAPAWAQPTPGGSSGLFTSERLGAPCYNPSSSNNNSCMLGLPSCTTELEPLFEQVKTTVRNRIDAMYTNGVDKDVFLENVESPIGKPVCAPAGIPAFQIPNEAATNHLQENCGQFVGITVTGSIRRPQIRGDFSNGKGGNEQAKIRGLYASSYGCELEQVLSEARAGSVRVSNACSALATDIRSLSNRQAALAGDQSRVLTNSAGLVRFFCAQGDLQRQQRVTDFCDAANSGQTGVFNSPELLRHRNSACLLRSAGASLLAAFGNFLACETFVRASAHYADVMYGNASPFQSELTQYFNSLGQTVRSRCNRRRYLLFWRRRGRRCVQNALRQGHEAQGDAFFSSVGEKYFSGDRCRL